MRFAVLFLLATPGHAHMMSMSSGDAVLAGTKLTYLLTMPLFEIAHTPEPERNLLAHIAFGNARMTEHECHPDRARDSYLCRAVYEFATAPDALEVHCTFPEVTVPNHVHLLRATRDGKRDRAVFDSAFTTATLRFRPPTPAETAASQIAEGAAHTLTGLLPVLFLITLALAASNWRDLAVLSPLFLVSEWTGARIPWHPAPAFLEAAAALAVAYLAIEVLFLPASPIRWLVAAVLGIVPGLVLAGFVRQSESQLAYVFAGAALVDLAILSATAALVFRFPRIRRVPGALSLAVSLCWFVLVLSR